MQLIKTQRHSTNGHTNSVNQEIPDARPFKGKSKSESVTKKYGSIDQRRPLGNLDTKETTQGCRHSSPDICKYNMNPRSCAFVRPDGLCSTPPRSWAKIYLSLEAST